MPYQSRNTGRLADLILRQGEIASSKAQGRGDLLANMVRGVASIPAGIQKRKAVDAEMREKAYDRQMARANIASQIGEREAAINERGNTRMDEQAAKDLALTTQKVSQWLGDIASTPDPEAKRAAYKAGRDALVAEGRLTQKDAPDFYPGDMWVKSRSMQLLPAVERFKQMFPETKAPLTLGRDQVAINQDTGAEIARGLPTPPPSAPNPTEASLAQAAAAGDPNALKALALIRGQRPAPQGPQPDYEWVTRNGAATQIRKGTAQAGDVPYSAPKSTSETAQDRQRKGRLDSARGFLTRLNELRDKINTSTGPKAGLTGMARQAAGAVGWDPDVAEYERVRAAGGRALAVAIMGAQNLSDADAEAWANMLPGARIDAVTAKRLTDQIGRMLEDTDTGPIKIKTDVSKIDVPGAPAAPAGWKYVPKPGGGWTAVEDK